VQVPDKHYIERTGVAHVASVCARGKQVFRELTVADVGIDGFIEVAEDGSATGLLVGVQIKSGPSYLRHDGSTSVLPSNRAHFVYWACCSFPVVGVVHDPDAGTSSWLDITGHCTENKVNKGPYTITWITGESFLTPESLGKALIPAALGHYRDQRRRDELSARARRYIERWKSELPTRPSAPPSREESLAAWQELVTFLVAPNAAISEIADAAYRVSWYSNDSDVERSSVLTNTLSLVTDRDLRRLLSAATHAENIGDDGYAGPVVDVLKAVPKALPRVLLAIKSNCLPDEDIATAIKVVEIIQERERDDLWRRYSK
jgi:Domain of unknown function (DUF4365)